MSLPAKSPATSRVQNDSAIQRKTSEPNLSANSPLTVSQGHY